MCRVWTGLEYFTVSPIMQTYEFTSADLEDMGEIGRGAFGSVNKMWHKQSQSIMAVKVRNSSSGEKKEVRERGIPQIFHELQNQFLLHSLLLLKKLKTDNLVLKVQYTCKIQVQYLRAIPYTFLPQNNLRPMSKLKSILYMYQWLCAHNPSKKRKEKESLWFVNVSKWSTCTYMLCNIMFKSEVHCISSFFSLYMFMCCISMIDDVCRLQIYS